MTARVAEQVLIYADTVRSPELRHEVPLAIPDPFVYAEVDGSRHVVNHAMELARMGELGFELHPIEEFGSDDLIKQGLEPEEIRRQLVLRACRGIGIDNAVVPFWFPLELADFLRENGIELRADREFFNSRRRAKNEAEVAGIRRAQRAAEAGMEAARELLRRATPGDGVLSLDGETLTAERIKAAIDERFVELGCSAEDFIVAPGAQGAVGHETGHGPIPAKEPLIIDVWPRDRETACFADMTRTFVVGEPASELAEWHALVREALDRAIDALRPGVGGRAVYDVACDVFEQRGFPTARTKEDGKPLMEGFFHGLGHGVGLEVHEEPGMGIASKKELVAGDVVTVEPGLYRQGYGGVRLEDLVLITEDGAENLTRFSYDLTP
jgi:Xaa-Pro aminopeptidase